MTEYHEPWEALPESVRNVHQAIKSLQEELEAVDWYHQRVATCTDPELKEILAHNRDEEMEHASMVLEWLRRRMEGWDANLRTYLFAEGSIIHAEEAATGAAAERATAPTAIRSLNIGSLKGR